VERLPEAIFDAPFGPDRLYLAARSYVSFLRSIFRNWEQYRWDQDDAKSLVIITEEFPYRPTTQSKLPVVILNSSGGQWSGMAPSQVFHGNLFSSTKTPWVHADIIHCVSTIHCIGRSDVEASKLGWTVFKAIPILRLALQKLPGIGLVEHRVSISRPYDASQMIANSSQNDWWATTVQSPFQIHEKTTVIAQPAIQNILDDITSTLREST